MLDSEIALVCFLAPVASFLAWVASYLPGSLSFLKADRNAVATCLIALGTVADIALAGLLLRWALRRNVFSTNVVYSVAFASYASVHIFASYVFLTVYIFD